VGRQEGLRGHKCWLKGPLECLANELRHYPKGTG
jgi:hypothetical protein